MSWQLWMRDEHWWTSKEFPEEKQHQHVLSMLGICSASYSDLRTSRWVMISKRKIRKCHKRRVFLCNSCLRHCGNVLILCHLCVFVRIMMGLYSIGSYRERGWTSAMTCHDHVRGWDILMSRRTLSLQTRDAWTPWSLRSTGQIMSAALGGQKLDSRKTVGSCWMIKAWNCCKCLGGIKSLSFGGFIW